MICLKEKYRFFYNNIKKHYALIIGEEQNKYYYLTLTHSRHYCDYDNFELLKNPNKNDLSNAYIVQKINKANKKFFKDTGNHLELSVLDKVLIDLFIIEPYLEKQKEREAKENKLQQENKNKNEQNKDKEDAKEIERER